MPQYPVAAYPSDNYDASTEIEATIEVCEIFFRLAPAENETLALEQAD